MRKGKTIGWIFVILFCAAFSFFWGKKRAALPKTEAEAEIAAATVAVQGVVQHWVGGSNVQMSIFAVRKVLYNKTKYHIDKDILVLYRGFDSRPGPNRLAELMGSASYTLYLTPDMIDKGGVCSWRRLWQTQDSPDPNPSFLGVDSSSVLAEVNQMCGRTAVQLRAIRSFVNSVVAVHSAIEDLSSIWIGNAENAPFWPGYEFRSVGFFADFGGLRSH